jgi:hypothetical protein
MWKRKAIRHLLSEVTAAASDDDDGDDDDVVFNKESWRKPGIIVLDVRMMMMTVLPSRLTSAGRAVLL